jgi:hypothetical protein
MPIEMRPLPDDGSGVQRFITPKGYILVHAPDHPLAFPELGTVLEHRMVLYDAGIDLPDGCEVHHTNGDPSDNRLENLQVLPRADHKELHADRLRVRSTTHRIVFGEHAEKSD